MRTSIEQHAGLRAIALFKAAKSLLGWAIGLWLCGVAGHDVYSLVASAARHLHLHPDWLFTQWLLKKAAGITDANVTLVIWTVFGYGLLHGAEAFGLWHGYLWAEWFTLGSGAIYIPLELHSMASGITWFNFGAFLVSLVITGYVGWLLYHSRRRRRAAAERE